MSRYVKIGDNYLVEQEIKKTKEVKVEKNLNHIFIFDRSGSMTYVLPRLATDLKNRMTTVPVGDTVTIGWFSSPGEYRFVVKGMKITCDNDYKAINKMIDANSSPLGSTCFSEILADTKQVVEDLSALGNTFALVFLTDGYPTVWPYDKEEKAIIKAIAAVGGKISSSLLVGYGDYYNKELMSKMAEQFGGSLIHSKDLKDFPVVISEFMTRARSTENRINVELEAEYCESNLAFSLVDGQVSVYQIDEDSNSVLFAPTKNAVNRIYVYTCEKPNGELMKTPDEPMLKAMYAAAYALIQRTNTADAIDVLGTIGDVALIDRANNAFTNAEYGAVEQNILDAIGKQTMRFVGGKDTKYLPKPDAFCVLDALDMLIKDGEANFYPYHDEFEYKKIGAGSKVKDGYPEFTPDKNCAVPLCDLVWNDSKLNLSIRAMINGSIDLPLGHKQVGLEKKFDTFIWRNYTIVKDGLLNVQKLPVTLCKKSYDKLLAEGVINQEHNRHYAGRVYVLHLDRIPVINRSIADGKNSATDLCKKVWEITELQAKMKVLNAMRNELEPPKDRKVDWALTPEQEEFVKAHGVTRSGFSPPTEKLPTTDFYMAKEFEIKIKGFSSLPKIDEVKAKVAAKKQLTASFDLMAKSIADADKKFGSKPKLERVLKEIDSTKEELVALRSDVQRTKFAVILAKYAFTEFKSREDNKLTIDGRDFEVSLTETKVDF